MHTKNLEKNSTSRSLFHTRTWKKIAILRGSVEKSKLIETYSECYETLQTTI